MNGELDKIRRSIRTMLIGLLIILAAVFAQSYEGRVELRNNQVKVCNASKPAREKQIAVYEAQADADNTTASSNGVPRSVKPGIRHKANVESNAAVALLTLNNVPCSRKYPRPSLLPF